MGIFLNLGAPSLNHLPLDSFCEYIKPTIALSNKKLVNLYQNWLIDWTSFLFSIEKYREGVGMIIVTHFLQLWWWWYRGTFLACKEIWVTGWAGIFVSSKKTSSTSLLCWMLANGDGWWLMSMMMHSESCRPSKVSSRRQPEEGAKPPKWGEERGAGKGRGGRKRGALQGSIHCLSVYRTQSRKKRTSLIITREGLILTMLIFITK